MRNLGRDAPDAMDALVELRRNIFRNRLLAGQCVAQFRAGKSRCDQLYSPSANGNNDWSTGASQPARLWHDKLAERDQADQGSPRAFNQTGNRDPGELLRSPLG